MIVLAFIAAMTCAGETTSAGSAAGTTWNGEAGVRQTTAEIEHRDRLGAGQPRTKKIFPLGGMPTLSVAQNSPVAQITSSLDTSTSSIPGPLLAQTLGINFTGATFFDCSGWPPDTMGTVGPTQFIVVLNGRIRSFSKVTGIADGGINTSTDTFFSLVMTAGANFSSDPHIRYDRLSSRWFVIMIDVPGQQAKLPNRVMIAMSDTGTITGSTVWTFFQFSGDLTNFADYPTLGIDANALYIGANIFSTSTGSFVNTTAFVVRKSSLLSGGPIVVTSFTGLITSSGHPPRSAGPFTPQGVDNYDPAATEGYFIGVDISSTSTLQLRRVSNPGGSPSLSGNVSVNVSTWVAPIAVTVQGTSGTVDALGSPARLFAAHYRNGSLWTAHNVAVNSTGGTTSPDRDGSRWYQINGIPTGQTPGVVQSGTVFQSGSANRSYWMGTVMVSGQGHAAIGFTTAGPNNFLDAATTGRLAGDPSGTMGTPVTYTASSSAYNPSDGSNPHRWGDYSYTSLDPSDDMTMWTIQEWCQSSGNGYAVQVARLLAPPPALPTNCTPSSLTQNVANVSVVIKGSPANGTGFFDPGIDFPNHINAKVNGGGVTVNAVTFNNPTNLTVNLTVADSAFPGARTITVTNPDGQSATSLSGLLTIISATNLPPTLAPVSDRTNAVGMVLAITNVATDADADQLTFSLTPGPATNATINAASGIFTWTPTQAQIGTNSFSVVVTDSGSPPLSATQSFNVTVVQSNSPPVLTPISNRTMAVGMTLSFTNVATDSDSDQLTFSLGAGAAANATINTTSGIFSWAPTQAQIGTNAFSVVVTDNGLPPLSATQSFNVTVVQSNSPPVLAAISNRTLAVGMTLAITNVATDSDGDGLTFSFTSGAATNATINSTNGIFSWSPTSTQIGTNAFSVIVTDNGLPLLSATQSFTVTVVQSNSPPLLAAISNRTTIAGMTLTFTNVASDSDADALTFSLGTGAAANASIDPAAGVFTWTPTQGQVGSNAFSVIVTDNGLPPLSATQSFNVAVVASNTPPTLAVISNQTVAVGMALAITNSASDTDSPPQLLTFSLESGAVTNASLDTTNGVFTWSPAQEQIGSNNFSVIVTDNGLPPLSATQSFFVIVLASNNPPSLAPISDQFITAGMTLMISSQAGDPDSPPQALTFSLGSGAAANADINATSGVFTWTPTQTQVGSNFFAVIVTDNGLPPLSATQSFTVTVVASNNPPTLAAISNQTIAVGMTLTLTNSAYDPDSPPQNLAFSLESGSVTNASLDATNGVFTWAPSHDQIGSNYFIVIVTDNGLPPLSATQSFAVIVVASNNPPLLAPVSDQTNYATVSLVLTNSASDPDSGDTLSFSLDPGAPAGASIGATNGVFTWTPSDAQAGANSITVRVTDNGVPNLSDAKTFSVTVLPRPLLQLMGLSNDVVTLTWSALAGTFYRIQFKTNLADAAWTDLVPDIQSTGPTATTTDAVSMRSSSYYRVFVVP